MIVMGHVCHVCAVRQDAPVMRHAGCTLADQHKTRASACCQPTSSTSTRTSTRCYRDSVDGLYSVRAHTSPIARTCTLPSTLLHAWAGASTTCAWRVARLRVWFVRTYTCNLSWLGFYKAWVVELQYARTRNTLFTAAGLDIKSRSSDNRALIPLPAESAGNGARGNGNSSCQWGFL
jgi:hypothetical protein